MIKWFRNAHLSYVSRHLETCDQVRITRFATHRRFSGAMFLVRRCEVRPRFDQLSPHFLFAFKALHCQIWSAGFGGVHRLFGDAVANLFNVEEGEHRRTEPQALASSAKILRRLLSEFTHRKYSYFQML